MNLLILTGSYPLSEEDHSPAGNFIPCFARKLQDMGHRVTVVTQDKLGETKGSIMDVPVVRFPWRGGDGNRALVNIHPFNPLNLPILWSLFQEGRDTLLKVAQQEGADIVLALWALPSGLIARMAFRAGGPRYAVWCLGSDINVYGRYFPIRKLLRRVLDESICNFADGLELCKAVEELAGRPCEFLPSTHDLSRVVSVHPDLEPGAFHFLFVGRWEKVKGLDVLIEAWPEVAASRKEARLHIVGGGSLKGLLERRMRDDLVANSVRLLERLPEERLKGYMERCHCLVIPSRMESIPLTFSEALQCGLPLIVTDVGDMGVLVKKHHIGSVVRPGDPEDLAGAVMRFDTKMAESFLNNLLKALEIFDTRAVAGKFGRQMENIMSLPQSKP